MFDYVFQQLNDLRWGTELIEVCGWDEELAGEIVGCLEELLTSFDGGDINDLKKFIKTGLNKFDDEIVEFIIETLELQLGHAININEEIN